MADLTERLRTIAKSKHDWHRNLGRRGPDYALSAEIEHQAAAEIERLQSELSAARALLAQYEQREFTVFDWAWTDERGQSRYARTRRNAAGKRRQADNSLHHQRNESTPYRPPGEHE